LILLVPVLLKTNPAIESAAVRFALTIAFNVEVLKKVVSLAPVAAAGFFPKTLLEEPKLSVEVQF
jgi:hypothetical protein